MRRASLWDKLALYADAADTFWQQWVLAYDPSLQLTLAERMGFYAEYRYAIGTDLVQELEDLCTDLVKEFRRPMVFAGQLVFQRETVFTRTLHHETAFSIQRRLQFAGIQVIILPIRVWQKQRTA